MTGPLPDPPELDPTELAGTNFGRARRGFEPTEVRSMLGRAADALRVWTERDAKLAARIEDLSARLDKAEEFDEARVTELLGVETARIVAAARDAAAEIREQATTESTELLARSRAEAESASEKMISAATADRAEASKVLADARGEAAETTSRANEEAERVLTDAREVAEKLTTDASEEAEATRTRAREEADTLTSTAQERHDEMVEAASRVLEERTSVAEASAAEIRSRAEEELDEARSTATGELERAREEAASIIAEAEAEAAEQVEAAREQGRAMVEEARDLRRQMLADIAERSRAGRQKVEAAKAARAEVLRMIRSVGAQVEGVVAELDDHDSVMRRAADDAAAAVPDDTGTTVRELEAQLMTVPSEVATTQSQRATVAPGHGSTAPGSTGDGRTDSDAVGDEHAGGGEQAAGDEHAGVDSPGAGEVDDDAPEDGAAEDGAADDGAREDGARDGVDLGDGDGPEDRGEDTDEAQMASVHNLFQKLRSEGGGDDREREEDGGEGPDAPPGVATVPGGSGPGGREPAPDGAAVGFGSVSALAEADAPTDAETLVEVDSVVAEVDTVVEEVETVVEVDAVIGADAVDGGTIPAEDSARDGEASVVDSGSPDGPAADSSVLDRRDEVLEPAEKLLGRTLKRLFSDEQNEVLDRVRRHKRSRIEVSDLLGDSDDTALFVSRLTEPYLMAAGAGATLWTELSGGDGAEPAEPAESDVAEALNHQVGELLGLRRAQLRETLETHAEAGGDSAELVDRLRSTYRELRASSVGEQAGDLATGGFALGTRVAAGGDGTWRWIPDNGGLPCADAEDNALAGPVACGLEFPTGDTLPPAHPGCRCILVPAE